MESTYCLIYALLLSNGAIALLNPIALVREVLQNNVAGIPLTHERTSWNFDPEAGPKRRIQYEHENGIKGTDLIERLGAGAERSGV